MKRISILSALLLMCAMTFAQQALWGGAPVVSPEIHDNNTVTFRLKAPKAVKVQVTGDFLPTQKIKTPFGEFDGPGVADLKENKDGVWEFTTPEPLKPELYSYTFLVDGLKINDPSNVYMIRDVASVTNVFIIGGDERIDLYKVNKVPHGTVSKVWYNSPTPVSYTHLQHESYGDTQSYGSLHILRYGKVRTHTEEEREYHVVHKDRADE